MKVEFSHSHKFKYDCVCVFGALSNQCKYLRQFAMPDDTRLSTSHYVVYITTDEQNVHKTNVHVANENIRQFAKPVPSSLSAQRSVMAMIVPHYKNKVGKKMCRSPPPPPPLSDFFRAGAKLYGSRSSSETFGNFAPPPPPPSKHPGAAPASSVFWHVCGERKHSPIELCVNAL